MRSEGIGQSVELLSKRWAGVVGISALSLAHHMNHFEDRLCDRTRRSSRPNRIRKGKYLNNRIEQDHRRSKRRVRSMLGFKSIASARVILDGIEMVHMMRKRQARLPIIRAPQ